MKVRKAIPMCIAVAGILAASAPTARLEAGQIEPDLEQRLQTAGADEFFHVVVRPRGSVEGSALKRQLAAQYATRAARHTAAIQTLQAAAQASQPPILRALTSDYFRDRAIDVEGFWIDNVISAKMTPSAIAEIADRPDVDEVALMPPIELVRPLAVSDATGSPTPSAVQSVESGLRAIKADSLWALGITGTGRLVASIDTGVEGKHDLLKDKWRGNNGYSVRESWYEPMLGDNLPRTFGDGELTVLNHGTQVIGIMVAASEMPALPDTFGVCPDCQWITAAAITIPCPSLPTGWCVGYSECCGNMLGALQWVADPDGDPMTETDVPDAVANPWGIPQWNDDTGERIPIGCADVLWNVIDNIEAAGAAMVFAGGNEGHFPWPTIRNPANRATTETNAFAVGMVDARFNIENPPIDRLSSRGPSDCDNVSIKPELVAPGVFVRSIRPPNTGDFLGQAGSAYGTSFSSPHVAAGIALLREYNPNATVDQIKTALLESARDLGNPGPDNTYGHGLMDLAAALRKMPPNNQPSLYIKKNYYERPAPGTSTELVLLLRSAGALPATGISVTMVSEDPRITILNRTATFPDVAVDSDTTGNFDSPFQLIVAPDVFAGERCPVRFEITADGGYTRTARAAVQVGPAQQQEVYTHDAGNFRMSVSAYAMFGMEIDAFSPRPGGEGFLYGNDPTQSLFEGALLVGTDVNHISDNAREVNSVPDSDFRNDLGGLLDIRDPGQLHTQETRAAFTDATAENPLGLLIEQRTWVDDDPERDDYLVIEYTIHNRSGGPITGLRAGMYFDWDFPFSGEDVATRDGGGFDLANKVGWMQHRDESRFRGLTVISPLGVTSYRYYDNIVELFDYDGFSNPDRWRGLSEGFVQTAPLQEGDGSQLIATGPFAIDADSAVTVAFAVIGATTFSDLITSAQQARADYSAGKFIVTPALQFKTLFGGDDPQPQQVGLSNTTEAAVDFTVDAVPVWASVDPLSGTVDPQSSLSLNMTATTAGLDAGVYTEDIVITASSATAEPIEHRISATLLVRMGEAVVNPDNMEFAAFFGSTDPDPQDLTLINETTGPVQFTVDALPTWAAVSPASGSVDAFSQTIITVAPTIGALEVGVYTDEIVITAVDASENPTEIRVPIVLEVKESKISVTDSLGFTATSGGVDPEPQEIEIHNETPGPVDFTVESLPTWVTVDSDSGDIASGEIYTVNVTAHVGDLEPDTLTDTIVITTTDEFQQQIEFRVKTTFAVIEEQIVAAGVNPNPFNPDLETVTLTFELPQGGDTRATIYDLAGLEVRTLRDGTPVLDGVKFTWDGKTGDGETVANGVYICHADGSDKILKVVVKK